jgi:hypothetical protein
MGHDSVDPRTMPADLGRPPQIGPGLLHRGIARDLRSMTPDADLEGNGPAGND